MKAFARGIGAVFMILGVIILMIGVSVAVTGFFASSGQTPSLPGMPDFSGLMILARLFAGGAVGLQGLFLTAIGTVLWMLAVIADNTENTNQAVTALLRRVGPPAKQ